MKNLLLIFVLFLSSHIGFGQNTNQEYPENYKPKSVNDALNYMNYSNSASDKEIFKNKSETRAVIDTHHNYGQFIRNSWLRHGNPKLKEYFYRNKVFPLDDISSILIKLFHRKLNNKDLDIKAILKPYKIKWREGRDRRKRYKDSINEVVKSYKVNDTITFKYYYSVIGNEPDEMEPYKKCQPKAIVLKRNIRKRKLFVKLISACKNNGIRTDIQSDYKTKHVEINETVWSSYWEWEQN